jgi:hypothetical protein
MVETITFLSFTSNIPPSYHYETCLYVVCYQANMGGSDVYGTPKVSEIGILSRKGGWIENMFQDQYAARLSSLSSISIFPKKLFWKQ